MGIIIERKEHVTTIIIDNPDVKNAIDYSTASELISAFVEFENDTNANVAVLWGNQGCFSSGANLKAIVEGQSNKIDEEGDGPLGPTRMLLSKPVIAAIAGYAVAGGFELALWCDLRVVEENAILGFFERRWGVPLIDGGTIRLPRIVGLGRALDLILTGRPISATEAYEMGLATKIVETGASRKEAESLAEIISSFPQLCLREDRLSVYEQYNLPFGKALKNEFRHGMKSLSEIQDGVAKFIRGEGRHGQF